LFEEDSCRVAESSNPYEYATRDAQVRRTFSLVKIWVAAAAVALVVASSAQAGFTPAWSYLPTSLRSQLASQQGGTLYLPARTPLFYRYRSGARVVNGTLTVPFTNRVRVRQGVWKWTKQTFTWEVARYGKACTAYASVAKTLQVDGNKVYSDGNGTTWRCVPGHVLRASGGALPDVGLATVVASGLDVAKRTSGFTVSLAVTPTTVRRGRTVLVHGVAGDCTAGDAVTIISHAFSAAHSFAGVPAVFAQVGSAGRFTTTTRIPATRRPGTYVLTARCGGGNLGVSAHRKVTR
jgi:hypothetical protein